LSLVKTKLDEAGHWFADEVNFNNQDGCNAPPGDNKEPQ